MTKSEPRARFTSTNTILWRGHPSAVFGPYPHGHESQCKSWEYLEYRKNEL